MRLLSNKFQVATFIALLFHVSGFIAIAFFKSQLFINLTPLNLLVSFVLILYTQEKLNTAFVLFLASAFIIGFVAEWLGVNKGLLFGQYKYGTVLGPSWQGVPWFIGVNWFITIYCVGVAMHMLHQLMLSRQPDAAGIIGKQWLMASLVIDGAGLAVFFDWVIEPVAVKLHFWTWHNGQIPSFNYWSWFAVSILLLSIFRYLKFDKHNLFAVHLLLIQFLFFLLLRTIL
jgi:bisanhydrobacterioruberin hydratase